MHRSWRLLALAVAAGVLFAIAACAAPASNTTTTSGNTVTLKNIAFNPSTLTVKTGATVTVTNADQVEHHIVIGTTDLGVQPPGKTVTWKAPADGVYIMKCLIHPTMSGQVTVGAGGSTIGTPPAGGVTNGTGGNSTAPGY